MSFTLPALPYSYDALEPYFDKATMEIHHTKHHQAYVTNLNNALASTSDEGKSLEDLVRVAGSISPAVRNNAGGHFNHIFFWETLIKNGHSFSANSALEKSIKQTFGSVEKLKEAFSKVAMTRFGSGWAWLIVQDGKLAVTSTPNQDNPLMDVAEQKGIPILGVDVWEHAYYLKYQNRRADYLEAFWKIVNWQLVEKRFQAATA